MTDVPPEALEGFRAFVEARPGEKEQKSATKYMVTCPVHDDSTPSLDVDLHINGKGPEVRTYCFGCKAPRAKILAAWGLTGKDLRLSGEQVESPTGCTLREYGESKRLPVSFLEGDGVELEDSHWYVSDLGKNVPAVLVPYADQGGEEVAVRYRISLSGNDKFRWEKGSTPILYGLHRIHEAREAGYVLIVEGESDTHVLWYRGLPAVGVPGASNWKDKWAKELDGIDEIFVWVEPDAGGRELWSAISRCSSLRGRLRKMS